ncbi:acyl-CoA reductase [Rufibacter glacialis]|uniref:Acyl-CoA reductase n=1 Tax=Rufibacter glacialis TaxID=1259555 RepID=A0A5M8QK08_9BACT|nr:acyl-CoA reductase [Rufibacter glacialis]KAA6435588.1 acyl-CoA reductase [Rufibacter glacialis]GGK64803.1 acyl-CoA reductase [Rufibacter glacialis]
MLTLEHRLSAFIKLGEYLRDLPQEEREYLARRAGQHNNFFDVPNVSAALDGLAGMLEKNQLTAWIAGYGFPQVNEAPKKVGVVMAGNIPAVGFHDALCILLAGHILHAKPSSDDPFLVPHLLDKLVELEPGFQEQIQLVQMLKTADAIIATGSDNTARYFEYYFAKRPHIIRKNRTSVAVLTGKETKEELTALGDDILRYYGLGCRNVAKAFVPEGYDFSPLFEALEYKKEVVNHHKYQNNYDYNKSIYLVNGVPHLDNGFLMVTESQALVSPISVLFYETYAHDQELAQKLEAIKEKLQCVVSQEALWPNSYAFGQAQCPAVSDYADGIDTLEFLKTL